MKEEELKNCCGWWWNTLGLLWDVWHTTNSSSAVDRQRCAPDVAHVSSSHAMPRSPPKVSPTSRTRASRPNRTDVTSASIPNPFSSETPLSPSQWPPSPSTDLDSTATLRRAYPHPPSSPLPSAFSFVWSFFPSWGTLFWVWVAVVVTVFVLDGDGELLDWSSHSDTTIPTSTSWARLVRNVAARSGAIALASWQQRMPYLWDTPSATTSHARTTNTMSRMTQDDSFSAYESRPSVSHHPSSPKFPASSAERQAQAIQWFLHNGGWIHPNITLGNVPLPSSGHHQNGWHVTRGIVRKGTTILKVPQKLLLTADQMLHRFQRVLDLPSTAAGSMTTSPSLSSRKKRDADELHMILSRLEEQKLMALGLLIENCLGTASYYYPYLQLLLYRGDAAADRVPDPEQVAVQSATAFADILPPTTTSTLAKHGRPPPRAVLSTMVTAAPPVLFGFRDDELDLLEDTYLPALARSTVSHLHSDWRFLEMIAKRLHQRTVQWHHEYERQTLEAAAADKDDGPAKKSVPRRWVPVSQCISETNFLHMYSIVGAHLMHLNIYGTTRRVIVPLADMINHQSAGFFHHEAPPAASSSLPSSSSAPTPSTSSGGHAPTKPEYGRFHRSGLEDDGSTTIRIRTDRTTLAGRQIFEDYTKMDNRDYMTTYGMVPEDNPHHCVMISTDHFPNPLDPDLLALVDRIDPKWRTTGFICVGHENSQKRADDNKDTKSLRLLPTFQQDVIQPSHSSKTTTTASSKDNDASLMSTTSCVTDFSDSARFRRILRVAATHALDNYQYSLEEDYILLRQWEEELYQPVSAASGPGNLRRHQSLRAQALVALQFRIEEKKLLHSIVDDDLKADACSSV